MITITNLQHIILKIPKLEIQPGITAICGDNGSGKSTLSRVISGIDIPQSGSVIIDNNTPRNSNIGYVLDNPDRSILFSKVIDEISAPLMFLHTDINTIQSKINEISDYMGIKHLLDRDNNSLSSGEKTVIEITTAIITDPTVLILDEPDANIDPEILNKLFQKIKDLKCKYIIWITHNQELIQKMDHKVILKQGQVI